MRKSGLHKQIASIFDGVGAASNIAATAGTSSAVAAVSEPPAALPVSLPDPQPVAAAAVCAGVRPMPVARGKAGLKAAAQGPTLISQFKTAVFGKPGMDPHQKKMTLVVGSLAAVFGVVLFISLGGVGRRPQTAAKTLDDAKNTPLKNTKAISWKIPAPLPETMRNPMKPDVTQVAGSTQSVPLSGDLVVKGIVFSQNKPSALIGNEILKEGQAYQGITIVRIDRDQVEFEANGKRWTQPVQR